jgi:hypothetical protein
MLAITLVMRLDTFTKLAGVLVLMNVPKSLKVVRETCPVYMGAVVLYSAIIHQEKRLSNLGQKKSHPIEPPRYLLVVRNTHFPAPDEEKYRGIDQICL